MGSATGTMELAERLEARREEIEQTVLTRVYAVSDPRQTGDPEYVLGLREAVVTALSHVITVLSEGDAGRSPLPPDLLLQARKAARSGVALDTVLRRYISGHTVICDYVLREGGGAPMGVLQRALRAEAALLDRMVGDVAGAYGEELSHRRRNSDRRRIEQVERLLAGEPQDLAELRYDFELWHLGVVARGVHAQAALRELAGALGCSILLIHRGGRELWGWLGGRRSLSVRGAAEHVGEGAWSDLVLAIGEPARGMVGWRLTHRQARAALPLARRGERIVCYPDVALLATVQRDEVLVSSLTECYLTPLDGTPDRGAVLRETLSAYFASGRNAASTAAALGVSRQTVARRLGAAEQLIGKRLESCGPEIETALRLRDLNTSPFAATH